MKFELYYKTNHQINQKEFFLSNINGINEDNIFKFISDTIYAESTIIDYRNTVDKLFIVTIEIFFEEIGPEYVGYDEKIELIKKHFPTYKDIKELFD